ncbi:hypothetical protein TELCIR_13566, partial [Teladorsagia circumcincta]
PKKGKNAKMFSEKDVFISGISTSWIAFMTFMNPASSNFTVILRLSHKYQVLPVIEACQDFVKQTDLYDLKPDEVMTLLIAAYDFHCKRNVLVKLIHRLAVEGNTVFARLKISRYLPAQVKNQMAEFGL